MFLSMSYNNVTRMLYVYEYCKTRIFRVPFISRPWRLRENNGNSYFAIFSVLLS